MLTAYYKLWSEFYREDRIIQSAYVPLTVTVRRKMACRNQG